MIDLITCQIDFGGSLIFFASESAISVKIGAQIAAIIAPQRDLKIMNSLRLNDSNFINIIDPIMIGVKSNETNIPSMILPKKYPEGYFFKNFRFLWIGSIFLRDTSP